MSTTRARRTKYGHGVEGGMTVADMVCDGDIGSYEYGA